VNIHDIEQCSIYLEHCSRNAVRPPESEMVKEN
jgi:hypothetical protein